MINLQPDQTYIFIIIPNQQPKYQSELNIDGFWQKIAINQKYWFY